MLGQALDGMASTDVDWQVQALLLTCFQHSGCAPVTQPGCMQEERAGPAPARSPHDAGSSQGARPAWTDNMLSDAGARYATPAYNSCSAPFPLEVALLRRAGPRVGTAARACAAGGVREPAGAGVCRAGLQLL